MIAATDLKEGPNLSEESEFSEKLPKSVECYTSMNGTKIYYDHIYHAPLYVGRISKDCSVGNMPASLTLIFAGEFNNEFYFYTEKGIADVEELTFVNQTKGIMERKHKLDTQYTFYKLTCDDSSTALPKAQPPVLERIHSVSMVGHKVHFATQQPFFIDDSDPHWSSLGNFYGLTSTKLSQAVTKHAYCLPSHRFFVRREVVYFIVWNEGDPYEMKITHNSPNVAVINLGGESRNFSGPHINCNAIPPSLHFTRYLTGQIDQETCEMRRRRPSAYVQESSFIYILFFRTLFVIRENHEILKIKIECPLDDFTIGGVNHEWLFLNTPLNYTSKYLGKEHNTQTINLERQLLQGNESSGAKFQDSEELPEDVTRFTLMDGLKIYFRSGKYNELYSGINTVDYLPAEKLIFAGEIDNSLHFYTLCNFYEEWIHNFYKCYIEKTDGVSHIIFRKIREVKFNSGRSFLFKQPYYLNGSVMNTDIIEGFDGREITRIHYDDIKDIRSIKQLMHRRLFVRRGIAYYILPTMQPGHITITQYLPNLVLVEMDTGIINRHGDPDPTSLYANDDSLVYVLFGQLLLVIGDDLAHETFQLEHPKCTIGGARDGRLFLNNRNNFHFSVDLGEASNSNFMLHYKQFRGTISSRLTQINQSESRVQDANNTKTGDTVEELSNEECAPLEKENKSRKQTLKLLTTEKRIRQDELNQLNERVSNLRESRNSWKTLYSSKQEFSAVANVQFRFTKEYRVAEILGIGGGGCVFKAENKFDERNYAVKRIAVDPIDRVISNALREVRAMAQLDHPGIVQYNSTWIEKPPVGWQYEADDEMLKKMKSKKKQLINYKADSVFIYIQMQMCNFSLTTWLSENNSPQTRRPLRMKCWFKQIVEAVEYLHDKNLIHRDLKPCNILFVEKDRLKICDLGIVTERKIVDGVEITMSRTAGSGTDEYMSPEQARVAFSNFIRDHLSEIKLENRKRSVFCQLNAKSDVFTLGLILTELCVVLDDDKKAEIFYNFRNGHPNEIFEDESVDEFVKSLTEIDRSKRPTCREMLNNSFLS